MKLSTILAGNRKFFVAGITGLVSTSLLLVGKIDMNIFKDIVSTVTVAYMSSNIGEHAVSIFKEKLGGKK